MSNQLTNDGRELLQRLSVQATMMIEDIHDCAVLGQSPEATAETYCALADRLEKAGSDLGALGRTLRCSVEQNSAFRP